MLTISFCLTIALVFSHCDANKKNAGLDPRLQSIWFAQNSKVGRGIDIKPRSGLGPPRADVASHQAFTALANGRSGFHQVRKKTSSDRFSFTVKGKDKKVLPLVRSIEITKKRLHDPKNMRLALNRLLSSDYGAREKTSILSNRLRSTWLRSGIGTSDVNVKNMTDTSILAVRYKPVAIGVNYDVGLQTDADQETEPVAKDEQPQTIGDQEKDLSAQDTVLLLIIKELLKSNLQQQQNDATATTHPHFKRRKIQTDKIIAALKSAEASIEDVGNISQEDYVPLNRLEKADQKNSKHSKKSPNRFLWFVKPNRTIDTTVPMVRFNINNENSERKNRTDRIKGTWFIIPDKIKPLSRSRNLSTPSELEISLPTVDVDISTLSKQRNLGLNNLPTLLVKYEPTAVGIGPSNRRNQNGHKYQIPLGDVDAVNKPSELDPILLFLAKQLVNAKNKKVLHRILNLTDYYLTMTNSSR